jgi:predicted metal-dependent peptidase
VTLREYAIAICGKMTDAEIDALIAELEKEFLPQPDVKEFL